jgi:ribosomal protein S18 acetylase RimI-like enzyme
VRRTDEMIRPYRADDFEALREITVICFDGVAIDKNLEEMFGVLGGNDWRWRKLRHIEADTTGENAGHVFVWEDGETARVVGYVTGRVDAESKIGWIPNLGVLPDYRGHGIGRKLLEHIIRHFRECGMECAKIETLQQNAIGGEFYPSVGFEEVARQIHYAMKLTGPRADEEPAG